VFLPFRLQPSAECPKLAGDFSIPLSGCQRVLPSATGFAPRSQARPSPPTESSSLCSSIPTNGVTDWPFSFRCSPPRVSTTQLRFDTARFFTAQKRTFTASTKHPLGRTSAECPTPQRVPSHHYPRTAPRRSGLRCRCGLRQAALVRLRRRPHGGVEVPVRRKFT